MIFKANNKAFTLIELLVVITIIIIMVTLWSRMSLSNIGTKEKMLIFNNKIISHYETIRNNALLWKWIDSDIWVPEAWRINYSENNITVDYLIWSIWTRKTDATITPEEKFSIKNISCYKIDNTSDREWNASVIINWGNVTLSWSCDPAQQDRVLKFDTNFLSHTWSFTINSLNWLIDLK